MTTQSEIFENYMLAVWNNVVEDNNGDVYDRHHDANEIAQVLMAKPMGQGDSEWREWLFPDGSICWIMISGSGTTNALP